MQLALIHANGKDILDSMDTIEFKSRMETAMRKRLPLVVATRGEIIKAWIGAFDQVTTDYKNEVSIKV